MGDLAVITAVHGRHDHLALQQRGLVGSSDTDLERVVVAMDDAEVERWAAAVRPRVHLVPQAVVGDRLPLAAARNAGARVALSAGARILVFLDVDCVPDADLVEGYRAAAHDPAAQHTLMCGPVSYLPPPAAAGYDLATLPTAAEPHPARPTPERGVLQPGGDPDLFWSLSFAVTAGTWRRLGGFCEEYVGYGGEDTDLAWSARAAGVGVSWVGTARAYHQHHPVEDPPVGHLDDILRNARIFHGRWGVWPMRGWLDGFVDAGVVRRTADGGYERT